MQLAVVVTRQAGVRQTSLHPLASSGRRTPRRRRAQVPCWCTGQVPRRQMLLPQGVWLPALPPPLRPGMGSPTPQPLLLA